MIALRKFAVFAALSLAPLGATAARAADFVELVRNLNVLQGEMAHGVTTARSGIAKQVEQIEQTVATMEPEGWKDSRNARAAAVFLLSGGAPRAIRKLADARLFSERDVSLISGSLAYAEGRNQDAAKLLSPIDPKAQPITLGGHLALIQGSLLIGIDNARALALFDVARLLMPSSLVEEAALRRELSIVDAAHSQDKFLLLGRRYVAQYSKSPFARNFWDEVGATTLRLALDLEDARLSEFQSLFKDVAPSVKFDLYMAIARAAILNARMALATAQTKRAERFAETQAERSRLKLYLAAVDALSGNFEGASSGIQQVDVKSMSRADLEMREIVTATIKRLQYTPEIEVSAAPAAVAQPGAPDQAQASSPIERSAWRALAETDALLQRASKP